MTKKALMAVYHDWLSPFRLGGHHIARELVNEGWNVGYLSSPISPFHLWGGDKSDIKRRLSLYKNKNYYDFNEKLWAYVPGAVLTPYNKPIVRSKYFSYNWPKFSIPNVIKLVLNKGFQDVDLLYMDSPNQAFWLDKIKYKRSIYRIADRSDSFQGYSSTSHIIEEQIVSRTDLAIFSARNLEEYTKSLNPQNMLLFPNGVHVNHFRDSNKSIPVEYLDIPHPIALYVGAMDFWFDYDLLNVVAQKLRNISFVLVGPSNMAKQRLKNLPNIYILGTKPYKDIPSFMSYADIGLIPFNVNDYPKLVNSVNPLKLYEYMACGLPVIASRWEELINLNSPALLYSSTEEFLELITGISEQKVNRESYIAYARKFDWSQKIKELLHYLDI